MNTDYPGLTQGRAQVARAVESILASNPTAFDQWKRRSPVRLPSELSLGGSENQNQPGSLSKDFILFEEHRYSYHFLTSTSISTSTQPRISDQ